MDKPAHWTEGFTLASMALWPAFLTNMVNRGQLSREEFGDIIDTALVALEQLDAGIPDDAVRAARAMLESLLDLPEGGQSSPSA